MKKHLLLLFLLPFVGVAQNLVPNPSFEDTLNCADHVSRIDAAYPWFSAQGTADYCTIYTNCSNCPSEGPLSLQSPHTGHSYGGLYLYQTAPSYCVREYIEVGLTQQLDSGMTYCVGWYQSRSEAFQHAVGTYGAVFTSDSLFGEEIEICNIEVEPQFEWTDSLIFDTSQWVHVFGEFEAIGTERFLTIGNFRNNEQSTIEFIDGQNFGGYYYIDDVYVELCDSSNGIRDGQEISMTLYPNPTSEILFIKSTSHLKGSLRVFKSDATVALELSSIPQGIDVSELRPGLYFLQFETDDRRIVKPFIKQ